MPGQVIELKPEGMEKYQLAYEEGRWARSFNWSRDSNPYGDKGLLSRRWFAGWDEVDFER